MKVERLANNPIVTPHMDSRMGENVNGPCLIRVPEWADEGARAEGDEGQRAGPWEGQGEVCASGTATNPHTRGEAPTNERHRDHE